MLDVINVRPQNKFTFSSSQCVHIFWYFLILSYKITFLIAHAINDNFHSLSFDSFTLVLLWNEKETLSFQENFWYLPRDNEG